MMKNLRKWLSGDFTCRKCGESVYFLSFGYGEVICPSCYGGEETFIFLDDRFWLNRLLMRAQSMNIVRDSEHHFNMISML